MCITAKAKRLREPKALRLRSAMNGVAALAATRHDSPHPSLADARFAAPSMNGIRFADMHISRHQHQSPPRNDLCEQNDRKRAWRDGAYGTSTAPRRPHLARGWARSALEGHACEVCRLMGGAKTPSLLVALRGQYRGCDLAPPIREVRSRPIPHFCGRDWGCNARPICLATNPQIYIWAKLGTAKRMRNLH